MNKVMILILGLTVATVEVIAQQVDYTGLYYLNVGGTPRFTLTLDQTGSSVTFSVTGEGLVFTGAGNVEGNSVNMTSEDGALTLSLLFSTDGTSLAGTLTVGDFTATVTGSTSRWTTYDIDANGLPLFVGENYIDLGDIDWVSLFRSSQGHDASDDFESCRSMKHYFQPSGLVVWSDIEVFSPIAGTITGWGGTAFNELSIESLSIESDAYPGIHVTIFHVDIASPLSVGDLVSAGQVLGTHVGSQTNSDIAVGIVTPAGYQLVSYFDVMTDALFSTYGARGATARSDFIITAAERDADPLECDGENFVTTGALPDRFQLASTGFNINAGLNDAWFNPDTDGQGFFITVFPSLGVVSMAWFTYDTALPAEDAQANLGDAGHRWLTALGTFADNQAVLNIDITSGGIFDTATEIQHTPDGTITLTFEDCNSGTVEYDIPSINLQGTVPIQRVANDNIALCEALSAE